MICFDTLLPLQGLCHRRLQPPDDLQALSTCVLSDMRFEHCFCFHLTGWCQGWCQRWRSGGGKLVKANHAVIPSKRSLHISYNGIRRRYQHDRSHCGVAKLGSAFFACPIARVFPEKVCKVVPGCKISLRSGLSQIELTLANEIRTEHS